MGEGLDLKAVTKDGEFFPVEVALNTIDTFDGVKVLAAVNDITSHKNIIDELSTRNAELDEFAYVASHDLKSPLRGIDQLASWLQQDLGEVMDEESSANLKMMRSRISRLETLLSDLLAYARAGNTTDNSELIDVGPWLSEVFDLHCVSRGFKLRLVDPMPKFNSLKTPLEVVFRNLISNSVKHHDQDEGLITISATERKKFVEFRYEDDGPGIPAEHRERAFGVFQTLRPRDEVEGSGMGLAIVRKIVKKFGGTITISDKKEPGVVFIFTWPKL